MMRARPEDQWEAWERAIPKPCAILHPRRSRRMPCSTVSTPSAIASTTERGGEAEHALDNGEVFRIIEHVVNEASDRS